MAQRRLYAEHPGSLGWQTLSYRAKRRLAQHAKRWLNGVATLHMTADLLDQRDAAGEVRGWFETIVQLVERSRLG